MTDFLEQGILIGVIATGIRLAIPYLRHTSHIRR